MLLSDPLLEANEVALPVTIRGRRFPLDPTERSKEPAPNTKQNEDRVRQMNQLSTLIKKRLSWFSGPLPTTTSELTQVYVESLQMVSRCIQETQELIPLMCEANFEFREEGEQKSKSARLKMVAKKLQDMIARTRIDIRQPANVINAKLLALPPETASSRYSRSLESNVERFVSDFFRSLDQLVDQQIAGLVEWTSQSTCCYHFFREVVIQEQTSRTVNPNLGPRRESASSPTGWLAQQKSVNRGTHTHRLARHEHHTTDAFHTSIEDTTVVMPPAVERLLAGFPDWLAPMVRVIDGKLARELIIERDIKTESWEEHEVEDTPVFACEPAVVIDHVVLTGWGPREIDAELTRRSDERRRTENASAQRRATFLSPITFTLAIGTSSLALWLFGASGSLIFGFLALLVAIPFWITGFSQRAIAIQIAQNSFQPMIATLGLTALLTGVGLLTVFRLTSLQVYLTSLALFGAGPTLMGISRWLTIRDQLRSNSNE